MQFAIVSSKKAAFKLNMEQSQSVNLVAWNSTHNYRNKLRKVDNFLKWIFNTLDEIGPLVEWITPVALKSDTLSVKLLSEPTLILFTPRSLILNISPYYDIVSIVNSFGSKSFLRSPIILNLPFSNLFQSFSNS